MIILNSFSSDHGLNHPHLKLQKYVFLEKSHNLELLCIDKLETLSLFYDWQDKKKDTPVPLTVMFGER